MSSARLTISVVIYRTALSRLQPLLASLAALEGVVICVVDNAGDPLLREHIAQRGWRYVCTGVNHGYGKGHNLALSTLADVDAPYHLVVNPDISFSAEGMLRMLDYMDEQPDVGQLMPRIIYPDGRLQHLCKLLPAPSDLLLRRFFCPIARSNGACAIGTNCGIGPTPK